MFDLNKHVPNAKPFLATAIYSALASHSLDCARAFLEIYPDSNTDSIESQIHQANRFWRLQLGSLSVDTIEARDYLVECNDANDWLRLFCENVVPVIVAFGLPKVHQAA